MKRRNAMPVIEGKVVLDEVGLHIKKSCGCEICINRRAGKCPECKGSGILCGMCGPNDQPDPINPSHYRDHPSGVECIDIVEHFPFNLGNAIKYLWRAGLKNPDPAEDLRKAAWYIQREIKRLAK